MDRVNLERSIEKLPPGYRTVFTLHDVQGYEHNEIAGIMGCSVGNSKSQLHKARTKLRDLLQEEVRAQARQERHAAKSQTGSWRLSYTVASFVIGVVVIDEHRPCDSLESRPGKPTVASSNGVKGHAV